MRGGDLSSPLTPAPTTSRLSPGAGRRGAGRGSRTRAARRRSPRPGRGRRDGASSSRPSAARGGPAPRSRPGRAGRPEPLAERLVPAPATPAFAARGMVVDRDPVADGHRGDPSPTRSDDADGLVAEHRRELGGDVPVGTSDAHTPHASTSQRLRRPGLRIPGLLDPHVAGPYERATFIGISAPLGDERRHERRGVTSNAGLRQRDVGVRTAGRLHLVRRCAPRSRSPHRSGRVGRASRLGLRPRTGSPRRPRRARASRCRPCWRRRRWPRRDRSRRSPHRPLRRRSAPRRRRRRSARTGSRAGRARTWSAERPAAAAGFRSTIACCS